jgi:hypothetical protein
MNTSNKETTIIECSQLVLTYCWAFDHFLVDPFVNVFSDSGSWNRPTGDTFHGLIQIRESFLKRNLDITYRHICSNILIHPIDENHARGVSLATVFTAPKVIDQPAKLELPGTIVEYEDEYIRSKEGQWKISKRKTSKIFAKA